MEEQQRKPRGLEPARCIIAVLHTGNGENEAVA
jgi:hypothetical protein